MAKGKTKKVEEVKEVTDFEEWEKAPSVINVDGIIYEKLLPGMVDVELDFSEEERDNIRRAASIGNYASEAEFIRAAFRRKFNEALDGLD